MNEAISEDPEPLLIIPLLFYPSFLSHVYKMAESIRNNKKDKRSDMLAASKNRRSAADLNRE